MKIIETERLNLRKLSTGDAEFILELLNDPSFIRYIGDKGVRNLEDAKKYIVTGPLDSYERHGFGLWLVELRDSETPIGMCGLLKRESLPDVDIGFAFLPQFRSKGYAYESAAAVANYGKSVLGLKRLVAITDPDNSGSIKLLEKIGLRFNGMIQLSEDAPKIKLFATN
jgi:RimJ/RimL family protein N-acetyltransferase